MKKSYLILAAVAGLLASCTQNEEIVKVVDEPVAIGLYSEFVDNATRAEMTMGWLQTEGNAFGVYGFKGAAGATGTTNLFVNEKVTYQEVETDYLDWRHPTVRFWDKSASNYNFYAYAPYNAYNVAWDNEKGFSFSKIPVIQPITENNADIVVAKAQEGYSYGKSVTDHTTPPTGHPTHADPDAGYVPFVFHHVLSKLSFKVQTHDDYATTAVFTVKNIAINFPTLTGTNAGVAWNETSKDAVAGTTAYTGYTAAEAATADDPIEYETTVYPASSDDAGQNASDDAEDIGKMFIVTPVNGTVTGHAFDIQVTYDVQYLKEDPENAGEYINDVKEENCIATGSITADIYKPNQNEWWIITIDINPAQIQFCVEKVENWTTDLNGASVEGDGQPEVVVQ